MLVKAKVSFCGKVSLGLGQTADLPDDLAHELISGGYVAKYNGEDEKAAKEKEEKEPAPVKKKAVKRSEDK